MKAEEEARSMPDHSGHASAIAARTVRLPLHFFMMSIFWLACGSIALPWLIPAAINSFYQMRVLSLVHVFTLGFISSTIMGVMYRYVPALMRKSAAFPTLAPIQFGAYALGVVGMVSHFALNNWTGLWWSAALVLVSIVAFALNMLMLLWPGVGNRPAETGMFAAICFLLLAASIGVLMGIEEDRGFVIGNLITSLDAHVTFAAIGWMTLTIIAASYRFVPAFILPVKPLPDTALWQLIFLILGTLGLGLSFFLQLPGSRIWCGLILASLALYVVIMARLAMGRRQAIDWAIRHVLAGTLWLISALVLGAIISWLGAWNSKGAPVASSMVTAALLGWAGNLIIGMSYKLFPGFVTGVRTALRYPAVPASEMIVTRTRSISFIAFNFGLAAIVLGLLTSAPHLGAVGGWILLAGAAPYIITTFLTLSFGYRRSVIIGL
jgi:hypothetical protein